MWLRTKKGYWVFFKVILRRAVVNNKMSNLKVVVAIPCFNTEHFIADVIIKARKYIDEVIVIDDGSQDKTAEIALSAGAKVIKHDINRGKGAAMKTAVANTKADIIVFIDGDGQHDPNNIPKLLEPILQEDADFVIGSRYLNNSKLNRNPLTMRRITNVAASFIISFIISVIQPFILFVNKRHLPRKIQQSKTKSTMTNYRILNSHFKWVTDCTSGFTAMKLDNWNSLNLKSNGYQIETEMIFEQAINGFTIAETPISCIWNSKLSNLSIIKDGFSTFVLLVGKFKDFSKSKND